MITENLDIIILTVIIALLFLVFILATIKEFSESMNQPFKGGKEKGIRAGLVEFVGKLFTDESIEPTEKKELINIMRKKLKEVEGD